MRNSDTDIIRKGEGGCVGGRGVFHLTLFSKCRWQRLEEKSLLRLDRNGSALRWAETWATYLYKHLALITMMRDADELQCIHHQHVRHYYCLTSQQRGWRGRQFGVGVGRSSHIPASTNQVLLKQWVTRWILPETLTVRRRSPSDQKTHTENKMDQLYGRRLTRSHLNPL